MAEEKKKGILSSLFSGKSKDKDDKTSSTSAAKPATTTTAAKPAATTTAAKPTTTTTTAAAATVVKPAATATVKPAASAAASKFTDVPAGAAYAEAVSWAVERKITGGTTETTFSPDNPCTRGHVATFLWRSKNSPAPKTTQNPFTDVNAESPFYQAILWASENNIVKGITPTTFEPGRACTRGEALAFLQCATGKTDADVTSAVAWAKEKGIVTDPNFGAGTPCTRADIVTYLFRSQGK